MATEQRLIDANALKEKLQEHHDFFVDGVGGFRYLTPKDKARVDEIINCIAEVVNAPTVDAVEVVHGRWVEAHEIKSFKHTNIPVVQCSKCECYFCDIINNHHYMYHYCPNCGAKMDGDWNG